MSYFRPIAKDWAVDPTDNDELYVDGDLVIEESDQRHIEDILDSGKGEWREFPALGVEIHRYLNSVGQVVNRVGLQQVIRVQLEYDNFRVNRINIVNSQGKTDIEIDAKRVR